MEEEKSRHRYVAHLDTISINKIHLCSDKTNPLCSVRHRESIGIDTSYGAD